MSIRLCTVLVQLSSFFDPIQVNLVNLSKRNSILSSQSSIIDDVTNYVSL